MTLKRQNPSLDKEALKHISVSSSDDLLDESGVFRGIPDLVEGLTEADLDFLGCLATELVGVLRPVHMILLIREVLQQCCEGHLREEVFQVEWLGTTAVVAYLHLSNDYIN